MEEHKLTHNNICMDSIVHSRNKYLLYHPIYFGPSSCNTQKLLLKDKSYVSIELADMLSECQDPSEVQDLPSCLDFHLADIYSLGLLVIELATLSEAYRFFDCTGKIIGDEI